MAAAASASGSGRSEPTLFGLDTEIKSPSRSVDRLVVDDGRTLVGVSIEEDGSALEAASLAAKEDGPGGEERGRGALLGEIRVDEKKTLFGSGLQDVSPQGVMGQGAIVRAEPESARTDTPGAPGRPLSDRRPLAILEPPLRPDRQIPPDQGSSLKNRERAEPSKRAGVNPDYLPPEGASPKTGRVLLASGEASAREDMSGGLRAESGAPEERRRKERINERVSELDLFIGGKATSANSPERGVRYGAAAIGALLVLLLIIIFFARGSELEGRLLLEPSGLKIAISDLGEGEYRLLSPGTDSGNARLGERREMSIVFPISMKSLELGENRLMLERIRATGARSEHKVSVQLPYHLDAQFEGEQLVLHVRVPARSLLSIDGEFVALDGEGRGKKTLPLGALEAEGLSADLDIRLKSPGGETRVERFPLRVPRARLRLGAPGEEFITERDTVVVQGLTSESAELWLDGQRIPIEEGGGFRVELALPRYGTYEFQLEARVEGQLPARMLIRGARIRDRAEALESYPAEANIAYAELARDPARFRGRRQRFEGLVYQIERRSGGTELQILSRNCPAGERCPFWISYGGSLELEAYRWVTVAGSLSGTRRVRAAEGGEIVHIPRLSAAIVAESARESK